MLGQSLTGGVRELLVYPATNDPRKSMSRIKVRDGEGVEYSFSTREEFSHAVEQGGISAQWQIFHSTSERWLPVDVHPAYQTAIGRSRKAVGQDHG